jgi:AraC-like DNA-binding protein
MQLTKKTQLSRECRFRFVRTRHPATKPLWSYGLFNIISGDIVKPFLLERAGDELFEHGVWLFTVKGRARIETAHQTVTLKPGTLCCMPGSIPRRITLRTARWSRISMISWMDAASTLHRPEELALTPFPDVDRLNEAVEGLLAEQGLPEGDTEATGLYARLVLLYLKRASRLLGEGEDDVLIRRFHQLWNEVRRDLARKWTVRELAARMFISDSYLHQICHAQFGRAPLQHLKELRMEQAKLLLANTSYPLRTIGEMVGYQSDYAFSNAFHKATGTRPGAYRNSPGPR